jgi:prepilin-type N-terminal cleavage/methylation domain-containing protein
MQHRLAKKQGGFTIVELLIVIVVIAILAAITIVAYNGIQNRAKNQQMATAVGAYYKAMQLFSTDNNGGYPSSSSSAGCLGNSAYYTTNTCYVGGSSYNYTTTINQALAPYMNNNTNPAFPTDQIADGSLSLSGIFIYPPSNYIAFPVFNSTACPAIAGAPYHSEAQWGAHRVCRIKMNPSI